MKGKDYRAVIDTEKCKGCGDCIEVCPSQAIIMVPIDRLKEALECTRAHFG